MLVTYRDNRIPVSEFGGHYYERMSDELREQTEDMYEAVQEPIKINTREKGKRAKKENKDERQRAVNSPQWLRWIRKESARRS